MIKTLQILSILFVAQLVLVTGVQLSTGPKTLSPEHIEEKAKAYLGVNFETIDKITIKGRNAEATLVKTNEAWEMPNFGQLKVAPKKIEKLFEKLKAIKPDWPVAQTDGAAKRFEVSEDDPRKRIDFYEGDALVQTLYLGTSPGFRKVHARVKDDNAIYSIAFNQFDASAAENDWFNTWLLRVFDEITEVTTPLFTAKKTDEVWSIDPMENGRRVDDFKFTAWVGRFSKFDAKDIPSAELEKTLLGRKSDGTYTVKTPEKTFSFDVYKTDDAYYLKGSMHEKLFKVPDFQAKKLLEATVEKYSEAIPPEDDNKDAPLGIDTDAILAP